MDREKYHELSVFCNFVVSPTGFEVSDSYKSKCNLVVLELYLIEYTAGRGLSIACNAIKMIVFVCFGFFFLSINFVCVHDYFCLFSFHSTIISNQGRQNEQFICVYSN
jgi:hypothetical protein